MDDDCKKAFLIILGIPPVLFLIFAWFILGTEKVKGEWFDGIFNDISLMWLPTIAYAISGWIIDKFLFDGSLLSCFGKKIRRIK